MTIYRWLSCETCSKLMIFTLPCFSTIAENSWIAMCVGFYYIIAEKQMFSQVLASLFMMRSFHFSGQESSTSAFTYGMHYCVGRNLVWHNEIYIYIYAIQCSLCYINGEVCYVAMLHYVGPCYIMSSTYIICWWYSMRRVSLELGFKDFKADLVRSWEGTEFRCG